MKNDFFFFASHESQESLLTKWICQQFIWSHPVAAGTLAGTTEPEVPLSESVF